MSNTWNITHAVRLECTDDDHNKFYELILVKEYNGFRLFKRWGRIDSNSGRGTWDNLYPQDSSVVEKAYMTLYNEKLRKGYKLVSTTPPPTFTGNLKDFFSSYMTIPKPSKPKRKVKTKDTIKAWADDVWDIL